MSGAGGNICLPIGVSPLPSLAWQIAQWSAQCARASARTAGDSLTGFVRRIAAAGIDRLLTSAARNASRRVGGVRAFQPSARVFRTSQAAAPAISGDAAIPARNHLQRIPERLRNEN